MLQFGPRMQRAALYLVVWTAIALGGVNDCPAGERTILWQSRDQFVALEKHDRDRPVAPNHHPHQASEKSLEERLASLEVRPSEKAGAVPLFTRESLDAIVPQLRLALGQAGPDQDVTFAVIGLYKTALEFAKSPRVTTGRMFVKDNRLNIIFGQVQQDFNERDDRRLAPFLPGERSAPLSGDWRLLPREGAEVAFLRRDWVALDASSRVFAEQLPQAAAPAKAVPLPPKVPEERRNPLERMTILQQLKEKGLISEEEYRSKRQQILDGL